MIKNVISKRKTKRRDTNMNVCDDLGRFRDTH